MQLMMEVCIKGILILVLALLTLNVSIMSA